MKFHNKGLPFSGFIMTDIPPDAIISKFSNFKRIQGAHFFNKDVQVTERRDGCSDIGEICC